MMMISVQQEILGVLVVTNRITTHECECRLSYCPYVAAGVKHESSRFTPRSCRGFSSRQLPGGFFHKALHPTAGAVATGDGHEKRYFNDWSHCWRHGSVRTLLSSDEFPLGVPL